MHYYYANSESCSPMLCKALPTHLSSCLYKRKAHIPKEIRIVWEKSENSLEKYEHCDPSVPHKEVK